LDPRAGMTAKENIALVRHLEARGHAQGRRLSTPARPQQGHDLSVMNVEGKVSHRRLGITRISLPQAPKPHRQFGPSALAIKGGGGTPRASGASAINKLSVMVSPTSI
jgi:hypothetical protein